MYSVVQPLDYSYQIPLLSQIISSWFNNEQKVPGLNTLSWFITIHFIQLFNCWPCPFWLLFQNTSNLPNYLWIKKKKIQFSSSSWSWISGITLFCVCQDHIDSMEGSYQITENYLRKQTSFYYVYQTKTKRGSKFKAIAFLWFLHNLQETPSPKFHTNHKTLDNFISWTLISWSALS